MAGGGGVAGGPGGLYTAGLLAGLVVHAAVHHEAVDAHARGLSRRVKKRALLLETARCVLGLVQNALAEGAQVPADRDRCLPRADMVEGLILELRSEQSRSCRIQRGVEEYRIQGSEPESVRDRAELEPAVRLLYRAGGAAHRSVPHLEQRAARGGVLPDERLGRRESFASRYKSALPLAV